jgi:hypothetical protein
LRRVLPLALAATLLLSAAPPAQAAGTFVRQLIRTSQWGTPSPDPTGIDFLSSGQLVVVDSEVEETPLSQHRNVWRITRGGRVVRSMSTLSFSNEPTDITVDNRHHLWFFSDDVKDGGRIVVVRLGPDHAYGTRDDRRRSFSTGAFGSRDPEGLAFGGGCLWISDGKNERIYRIRPGRNGRIDGGADDIITSRSLRDFDVRNVEGIEYRPNGHVFVLPGTPDPDILEIRFRDGSLVRRYDLSAAHLPSPSSIAYGPSSGDRSKRSFYITDRGIDNAANPNENDGRIVELGVAR